MIIDAGPLIVDGENLNSRLWPLIKRATERGDELHTTHPVLAQVWRQPTRQANLARAVRYFEIHSDFSLRRWLRMECRSSLEEAVQFSLFGEVWGIVTRRQP